MIKVDREKCIGCELCIKDCPARCISLVDEKAEVDNNKCFKCCHCIAICPKGAVATDEFSMHDATEYDKDKFEINPENLLNFIKFRRSVRAFKAKEVEEEKLKKIIEAGRFTPTSRNSQDVRYVVVREGLEELTEMVLESLNEKGQYMLNESNTAEGVKRYAQMWVDMYKDYKEAPDWEDRIYFNAPAVICVIAEAPINGGLASTSMELMINALGLGTFYSGFTVRAVQGCEKIRQFLDLKDEEQLITCMVVGYPAVKYARTAPRKTAEICWK